jgi:hypothetical protein
MARNRKNHSAGIQFVPAFKALIICLLLGASSVGYVLQKNKIFELGARMGEQRKRLKQLQWENTLRAAQLKELQTPAQLERRIREHNLGLVLPQPNQVIWIQEPVLASATNEAPQLIVWDRESLRTMVK